MAFSARLGLLAATLLGVAAVQDGKDRKIETYVQNTDEGVEIRAPISPGKDQMWEAAKASSGFFKDSAVVVKHRIDTFSVEANCGRKDPNQQMSAWNKPSEIAKSNRERFTAKDGDKEPHWKSMKVVAEDPKAKLAGLGAGYMHRLLLTDQQGGEHEIIEYHIISSDVLYRVTVHFTKESYAKYFAREGQLILNSIRRCKYDPKKK
jgi:hypothetical protein